MKMSLITTRWLGMALACGAFTFAVTVQAAKPPKPTPTGPAYTTVLLGGLRDSQGEIHTSATDINNVGQVVGGTANPWAIDYLGAQAGFLIDPRDVNGDGKLEWYNDADADGVNDLIISLGTLPVRESCNPEAFASAVNDLGMVVGCSLEHDPKTGVGIHKAFILVPKDVNADGQLEWYDDANRGDGFNDLMIPLGRPLGVPDDFVPTELNINNAGQVIGYFYDSSGANPPRPSVRLLLAPVLVEGSWQWFQDGGGGVNNLMENLGGFMPLSINDSGWIVGGMDLGVAALRNPDGSVIELKTGGTVSVAEVINNRGQIGVWWKVDGIGHAGLLTPLDTNNDGIPETWFSDANSDGINDLIVDLGAVRGLENSYIVTHGLNASGAVLGGCWHAGRDGLASSRAAVLWQNGVPQTLKSLTGIEFSYAEAINDAGQIIADASGREFLTTGHACILLPTR